MSTEITPDTRRRLALATGVSEQYLYQCLSGRRDMSPGEAIRLEIETRGELRRWALCKNTWFKTWPELVKAKGAPPVPVPPKVEQGA